MEIQGVNLVLREWRKEDFESFCKCILDEEIKKNLRKSYPKSKKDAEPFFHEMISKERIEDFAMIVDNQIAGNISFTRDRESNIELSGAWVRKEYRSTGVSKEGVKALIDHLIRNEQFNKIYLHVYARNSKSMALAQSLGFSHNPIYDKCVPSLERSEEVLYYFEYSLQKVA